VEAFPCGERRWSCFGDESLATTTKEREFGVNVAEPNQVPLEGRRCPSGVTTKTERCRSGELALCPGRGRKRQSQRQAAPGGEMSLRGQKGKKISSQIDNARICGKEKGELKRGGQHYRKSSPKGKCQADLGE